MREWNKTHFYTFCLTVAMALPWKILVAVTPTHTWIPSFYRFYFVVVGLYAYFWYVHLNFDKRWSSCKIAQKPADIYKYWHTWRGLMRKMVNIDSYNKKHSHWYVHTVGYCMYDIRTCERESELMEGHVHMNERRVIVTDSAISFGFLRQS